MYFHAEMTALVLLLLPQRLEGIYLQANVDLEKHDLLCGRDERSADGGSSLHCHTSGKDRAKRVFVFCFLEVAVLIWPKDRPCKILGARFRTMAGSCRRATVEKLLS